MTDSHPIEVALENQLMSQGVYVTDFETGDDEYDRLEYEVVYDTATVTPHEVGTVVRTALKLDEERDDWELGGLEVVSRSTDGNRRGTWRIDPQWVKELHETISESGFSQLVLDTISHDSGGN
ncbi:hypothetical protein OB919_00065 [Halobacteria archaeon AArc-curdl1]|uniref:DUF8159 domain-containing protein n=1 Tax=Natronosalvus hydrolyticus TaxID=2979988 RepID=A0AAP3E5G1_9EURY|nr:hypothetical protein [Halobacteria archaeon AArc-curdl1]